MPRTTTIKPTHRAVKAYYEALAVYGDQHVSHETALRSAFQTLLADTAKTHRWTLIPELGARVADQSRDREGAVAERDETERTASSRARLGSEARLGSQARLGSEVRRESGHTIRPDGTLRDGNSLPRGYWEAKDTADDLDAEIVKKTARGYSLVNTIFEDTRTAVLSRGERAAPRGPYPSPVGGNCTVRPLTCAPHRALSRR